MTMARKAVVRAGEAGVYHCVSRCVRRAFLCGVDGYSGRDYEHRKGWVVERLRELANIFALEVFGYAVMANHLHVIVRSDPEVAQGWDPVEVMRRRSRLFPLARDGEGRALPPTEEILRQRCADGAEVAKWRQRLSDLSWFMRCLKEPLARRANREDQSGGAFWEGRFRCQRLADEGAILACMAYVDLNPVRAGLAETLEASDFTSVQDRIAARQAREVLLVAPALKSPTEEQKVLMRKARQAAGRDAWLTPVESIRRGGSAAPWGLDLEQYLRLVDCTGRGMREDKTGAIPADLAPILDRMALNRVHWVETVRHYGSLYYRVAGSVSRLLAAAKEARQRWFQGVGASARVYCEV